MIDKHWAVTTYDQIIGDNGLDGATVEKARAAFTNAYVDAVESGAEQRWQTDLIREAKVIFDSLVKPERDRRRSAIKKDWEYILAAAADDTILGAADPTLQTAYPVGTGVDKTLYYWTREDFRQSSLERYRNAADAAASAKEFDEECAQPLISAMARHEAAYLGELFEPRAA